MFAPTQLVELIDIFVSESSHRRKAFKTLQIITGVSSRIPNFSKSHAKATLIFLSGMKLYKLSDKITMNFLIPRCCTMYNFTSVSYIIYCIPQHFTYNVAWDVHSIFFSKLLENILQLVLYIDQKP